jgi:hypothetical protein
MVACDGFLSRDAPEDFSQGSLEMEIQPEVYVSLFMIEIGLLWSLSSFLATRLALRMSSKRSAFWAAAVIGLSFVLFAAGYRASKEWEGGLSFLLLGGLLPMPFLFGIGLIIGILRRHEYERDAHFWSKHIEEWDKKEGNVLALEKSYTELARIYGILNEPAQQLAVYDQLHDIYFNPSMLHHPSLRVFMREYARMLRTAERYEDAEIAMETFEGIVKEHSFQAHYS